jgi:hypothetical protein
VSSSSASGEGSEHKFAEGQRSIKDGGAGGKKSCEIKYLSSAEKIKCDDNELRNGMNVQLARHVRVPLPSYKRKRSRERETRPQFSS